MDEITKELIQSSKNALNWLIQNMGSDEWYRRRTKVISYFNELSEKNYNPDPHQLKLTERKFDPIAFYGDWLAWYMYLIESQVLRPTCGDLAQLARIQPVFAAIGRRLNEVREMDGIEDRVKTLLNEKNRDSDACLFELVVASCYARNGWSVKFIKETSLKKTPDFEVRRRDKTYLVECKKLAKVNSYAEKERLEWHKLPKLFQMCIWN